jgi:hypothetical protein
MEPWDHILSCLNYTGQDDFTFTADQIKECGKSWKGKANQFEPRLLAGSGSSANARPACLKKHNLCILPVANGTYQLLKQTIYTNLDYSTTTEPTVIKKDNSSVMLEVGESEKTIIDNLRYSGAFERPEILNEPITHGPLLNGRHRMSSTEMTLHGKNFNIKGVQYETDSCYESASKILIIEGKSSSKPIDSFNIRQLYFPFREAHRLAKGKKSVVCVFIHDLKGVIHVWKYTFTNVMQMDSITLLGHYTYTFSS